MAGPVSPGAVQRSFSEEFLTCAVCMEYYDEPRQLNCLHSFCTACVDAIIRQNKSKGSFPCPMCMTKYDIPEEGASGFKIDFRIKNLFEFMENERVKQEKSESEEEESVEEERGVSAEMEENITAAIRTAKVTNKRIKNHMNLVKSREQQLNSKYDGLLAAVNERENEICKIVLRLCQSYRDIIEHDRKQMQSAFQEELQSAKESKWFLATCYQKFKEILTSEATPSQLVMLQLDATVAQISNEDFQTPNWCVPRLDIVQRSQEDMFTLHSLVGSLIIDRQRERARQRLDPAAMSENEETDDSYHTGRENESRENSDDDDSDTREESEQDLSSLLEAKHEPEEEEEDQEEGEEEDEDEGGTVLTEHCHRRGLLALRRRRKKRRKRVEIGCALLKQTAMTNILLAGISMATPLAASKIADGEVENPDT